MKKLSYPLAFVLSSFLLSCSNTDARPEPAAAETTNTTTETNETMKDTNQPTCETSSLGAFSVSLSVKDLQASKEFYEKLGFSSLGGDPSMNYLIMKNGNSIIGLFQGMFEGNILTFNPGWDENAQNIEEFDDIRTIQENLLEGGINIDQQIEAGTSGPASLMITDPDGNVILLDQHR